MYPRRRSPDYLFSPTGCPMSTTTVKHFIHTASRWEPVLKEIVASNYWHAQWINTLSFLENSGAKKISASEHPTEVKEEVLKHAAEEFRHGHYLKTQISRISETSLPDYTSKNLLGGLLTKYYLHLLDLRTCRVLENEYSLSGQTLKTAAYILVTYAIELRASELYPLYHDILKEAQSKITVKSIILEEQGHLQEMERELKDLPHGEELLGYACQFEGELCLQFVERLEQMIFDPSSTFTKF
ncbi:Uncharacterized protein BN1224_CV14_A_10910 [Chlamydia pneumoniae]|uniref:Thiaminase-2/PQQC domain-containing protein n=3 Tax=Chlamydia pneumoniae TaxID=83558 RepID=A0A0F7X3P1_CHLPN|nr:Uncharacterized protein BN1224_Wien1_A_10900 [Chlamydia pneumoniae]CRI36448.1 Uncharacterized protein BN1224_CM1_A_10950 [Chlamydia pneumoniae]CRI37572.1 Uncharacterized protein BN1224_CV14_A_10910 [Chlamydia pneumoniae]CRI38704.1 Uncharacterized protein BN1224_CV15_C_05370 [Chlamydia pneumoniae]CRI39835.1 Uncharacterized protein BN1224_CWL011_A_10990 [Chlamydia pneumoniae]